MMTNVFLPKNPLNPIIHDKIKAVIPRPMNYFKPNSTLSNKRDAINTQKKRKNKKVPTPYHCFDPLLGSFIIAVTPLLFFIIPHRLCCLVERCKISLLAYRFCLLHCYNKR